MKYRFRFFNFKGLVELVLLFFKDSNFEEVIKVYELLEKFLEKKMGD